MEASGPATDRNDSFHILCALAGLVVALLAVGVVSHLVVRHIIQVIPAAIAAIFVAKGGRAGRYAALPIFVSWLLIMLAIWLFLLGIARIVSGTFTPAEIALTVVIGVCSLWGVVVVLRQPRAPLLLAIIYFVGFAALQFLGLRISLLPAFVRR